MRKSRELPSPVFVVFEMILPAAQARDWSWFKSPRSKFLLWKRTVDFDPSNTSQLNSQLDDIHTRYPYSLTILAIHAFVVLGAFSALFL